MINKGNVTHFGTHAYKHKTILFFSVLDERAH